MNDCQNASHVVPYKRGVAWPEVLSHAQSMADRFKVQKEAICLHIHRVHIRFTLCQACSYNIKGVDGGGGVGYLFIYLLKILVSLDAIVSR